MDNGKEKGAKRLHSDLTPPKAGEMDMGTGVMAAMKNMLHEVLQGYGLDTIKKDIVDLKHSVENASVIGEEAKAIASENKTELVKLRIELEQTKQQLKLERDARLRNECQSRRSNLRFYGFPEVDKETDSMCEATILECINKDLRQNIDDMKIERSHRLGPKGRYPRPIIVKFSFYKDRELVWGAKKNLKGTNYFMKEDFPPEIEKKRNILLPVFLAAKRDKTLGNVSLVMDKLYINKNLYTSDTIHRLPLHLRPENLATRQNDTGGVNHHSPTIMMHHSWNMVNVTTVQNSISWNIRMIHLQINRQQRPL